MSNYNSIEKIISAEILRTNEDNLIANRICNTSFKGDIKNAGDSVTFIGLNEPTVADYTGAISYESIDDTAITLNIDKDKYFAFRVKDLEELRSSIGLKDSQTKRASYNLKKAVDTYVLGLYASAGTTLTAATVTPANALTVVAEMKEALEKANVPDGQSWIVIPPFLKTKLILAGIKFSVNAGINGTGAIGYTDELGCDLFVSNQLATSGTTCYALAGSYSAVAYAEQILDTQVIERLEDSFDTAVRGRIVFGAKVIKPEELICAPVTDGGNSLADEEA
ncbi:MAG: P22 phage major capsid protein family protein [Eubacteriales bacterium]|nr:P22 phage major capsid protein family protein [Eubacteriales bacterium]